METILEDINKFISSGNCDLAKAIILCDLLDKLMVYLSVDSGISKNNCRSIILTYIDQINFIINS